MPQVALVADQHDNDVLVGMIAQLSQPSLYILVGQVLGNVVYQQGTDSTPVVRRRNSTITLLTSCVPDLSLDYFVVDLYSKKYDYLILIYANFM